MHFWQKYHRGDIVEEMDKLLLNMYYSPGIMLDVFFFLPIVVKYT